MKRARNACRRWLLTAGVTGTTFAVWLIQFWMVGTVKQVIAAASGVLLCGGFVYYCLASKAKRAARKVALRTIVASHRKGEALA